MTSYPVNPRELENFPRRYPKVADANIVVADANIVGLGTVVASLAGAIGFLMIIVGIVYATIGPLNSVNNLPSSTIGQGQGAIPSTVGQGTTPVNFWIVRYSSDSPCFVVDKRPSDTGIIIVGTKDYVTPEDAAKDMATLCKQ